MALHIYDSLRAAKIPFEPILEGCVRMYVCGVTPYAECHLGHARCYIAWDMVYRYLKYSGYDVTYVRNSPDVDDKSINAANERGVDPLVHAEENIQLFYADMDALGVERPQFEPRVSTSIDEIISLISRLEEKGYAYCVEGDVYFEVARFKEYGKLSKPDLKAMRVGALIEVDGRKRDPMDFLLWKSAKPGETTWESPWGKGRPGWHIGCSAMSMSALGETFDLHCGGRDLVFPHHENEIAQSEAASGSHYVNYWMHNGFININEEKMSKSQGNVFNIHDILQRYEPLVLRFFLMTGAHYRNPIDFGDTSLDEAASRIVYFYETLRKVNVFVRSASEIHHGPLPYAELVDGVEAQFREAMDDDFNISRAMETLSEVFKLLNDLVSTRKPMKIAGAAGSIRKLMASILKIDTILNLFCHDPEAYLARHRARAAQRLDISTEWVETRISQRIAARTGRDWALADTIRKELHDSKVVLMDHPGGTDWSILEAQDSSETTHS